MRRTLRPRRTPRGFGPKLFEKNVAALPLGLTVTLNTSPFAAKNCKPPQTGANFQPR